MSILPKEFYQRDTVIVAKDLLGKKLVRKIGNYEMSGTIIETEAYRHKDDPASHAFRKITDRNKVMFGEVGIAYVYFTYGMHYCFNVVAKKSKTPAGAVLIRGISPEKGIAKMEKNRNIKNSSSLSLEEAYRILNLDKNKRVTKDDVNKAYIQIQKKIHPDISPETSRLSMIVNEAKEIVLKDIS